jgi:drug/metabolite transporter (DMT)-like permease
MTNPEPARWKLIAAFAAVYLIWGSTYLGIRYAIETLPPFLMAATRFLVAGPILFGWMWFKGGERPTRLHWRSAAIVGALLLLGGNGGVTWSEQHITSGFAALVVGAMPLWMAILGWLVFGMGRPTGVMAIGLGVGLAGILLLVGPSELVGGEDMEAVGVIALLIAALSWATGSLYSRRAAMPKNPLMATGMEMIAGGLLLLVVGLVSGEASDLDLASVSLQSFGALLYLTFFGSLIAFTAYIWLLNNTTTARAASYAYVNPVVALFLGWALAGEPLSARTIIAAAIIIGSVVVITSYRAQGTKVPAARPIVEKPAMSQGR